MPERGRVAPLSRIGGQLRELVLGPDYDLLPDSQLGFVAPVEGGSLELSFWASLEKTHDEMYLTSVMRDSGVRFFLHPRDDRIALAPYVHEMTDTRGIQCGAKIIVPGLETLTLLQQDALFPNQERANWVVGSYGLQGIAHLRGAGTMNPPEAAYTVRAPEGKTVSESYASYGLLALANNILRTARAAVPEAMKLVPEHVR